jgi:hypothetical protein
MFTYIMGRLEEWKADLIIGAAAISTIILFYLIIACVVKIKRKNSIITEKLNSEFNNNVNIRNNVINPMYNDVDV